MTYSKEDLLNLLDYSRNKLRCKGQFLHPDVKLINILSNIILKFPKEDNVGWHIVEADKNIIEEIYKLQLADNFFKRTKSIDHRKDEEIEIINLFSLSQNEKDMLFKYTGRGEKQKTNNFLEYRSPHNNFIDRIKDIKKVFFAR